MLHIPVRKCFWEALETALEAQTHRLARDIASALQVDETPLLKSLRTEKLQVYLFDDSEDTNRDISEMRCKCFTRIHPASPFLKVCNAPIVWPNSPLEDAAIPRCLTHTLHPETALVSPASMILDALTIEDTQYYLDTEEGILYSDSGEIVGRKDLDTEEVFFFEIA